MLSDASLASWAIGKSRFVGTAVHAGMIRPVGDPRSIVKVHAGRYPRRELDDWQIVVIRKVVDPRA